MLNLIAAFLSMVIATALAIAGVDWITLGHGLNPWLAFPLSAVFAVVSIIYVGVGVITIKEE